MSTAQSIINDLRGFANTSFTEAKYLLNDAQRAADRGASSASALKSDLVAAMESLSLTALDIDLDLPSVDVAVPEVTLPLSPDRPLLSNIGDLSAVSLPDAPSPLDTSALFRVDVPTFTTPDFTETAPNVSTALDVPDAPSLSFPAAPDSVSIDLPTFGGVTLPTFDVENNARLPDDPEDTAQAFEDAYNAMAPVMRDSLANEVQAWITRYNPGFDAAMAKLEAKLSSGIDGGTAMSDDIEQAMFDRARTRAEMEKERADEEALNRLSKRGHKLPGGAVVAQLARNSSAASKNISEQAGAVAIERAKLEQEHAQFIINASSSLRTALLNTVVGYANSLVGINSQAVQYSRAVAESMVDVYNAMVNRYSAELDSYRTESTIYETRIKAALSVIDAFEAEIKVAQLSKDIERIDIENYQTRIEAEKARIDVYLAELQGIDTQANIRKTQVEVFGEKVRAYVAQVQGKEAEFNAYAAALKGDEARIQAYNAQVDAYTSEVQAAKVRSDIDIERNRSIVDYNEQLINTYESEVRAYATKVQAAIANTGAQVDVKRLAMDKYRADLSAIIERAKIQLQEQEMQLEQVIADFEGQVKVAVARGDIGISGLKLQADTAAGLAATFGTMAASAASSQNGIATVSE